MSCLIVGIAIVACDDPAAPEIAHIAIVPGAVRLSPGDTIRLDADIRDEEGRPIPLAVTWSSTDSTVFSVDSDGLVTGIGPGAALIVATAGGQSGFARVTVVPVFLSITTGAWHSCALTTVGGTAFCWGLGVWGQLGDGSTLSFTAPVRVSSPEVLTDIDAGYAHTCGIGLSRDLYCWGYNTRAQLGLGDSLPATCESPVCPVPELVVGGLKFLQVSGGIDHTCAIIITDDAYCWGRDSHGALGDGSTSLESKKEPGAVKGPLLVSQISAFSLRHTCAVGLDDQTYCWGEPFGPEPVPVGEELTFAAVSAGGSFTCGLEVTGGVYCWGSNLFGQLGDGTTTDRSTPGLVSGGHEFASVSAGVAHACGITTDGRALCWGFGTDGQLGDGSFEDRSVPVEVVGGLVFAALDAGGEHTCGLTPEGVAYCWGSNEHGQLGDGSMSGSATPVRVADPRLGS